MGRDLAATEGEPGHVWKRVGRKMYGNRVFVSTCERQALTKKYKKLVMICLLTGMELEFMSCHVITSYEFHHRLTQYIFR